MAEIVSSHLPMRETCRWLVAWIGAADHESSESMRGNEIGPIATAMCEQLRYDRILLLTNYDLERSKKYCHWLQKRSGYSEELIDLCSMELASPIDYADIYSKVSTYLRQAGMPKDDVELTFHLSPGTPAMAAIWIILAKTRFPAKLIQTSKERGLESIDFNFDLAGDFLPEYLQRVGDRASRLVDVVNVIPPEFGRIVHKSAEIDRQINLAKRIAAYEVPALILGETGTGKELFAEAMHAASLRARGPFIAVNCGALTSELANSELFGHKKGAFTGATFERKGLFVEATGGTLFLDEVGDLPHDTQVRLLRALQSKEVTPLGQSMPVKVNVRIIAATHRNLTEEVAAGRFREDLYHRLAVGIVQLPPLRERVGDVELLAEYFLGSINADSAGRPEAQQKRLSRNAVDALNSHPWPGNIRELYHALLRAVIWSTGEEITREDVMGALLPLVVEHASDQPLMLGTGFKLQEHLDQVARVHIDQAMKQAGRRPSLAAKILGFSSHQTLNNWIKRLDIKGGRSD